jgi:HlyD family secretion protein
LGESTDPNTTDPIRAEKIAALRNQIRQADEEYRQKVQEIQAERRANESMFKARSAKTQVDLDFVKTERQRLALIAPVDGFVESIAVGNAEVVPQHKEMLKINPLQPTRIRGFVYEHSEISYQLGDTVQLSAYSRPTVLSQGVIIGSNPQVVELPVRLRKMPEVRTWGRELFIKIPNDNPFYLNEKIVISFE